MYNLILKVLIGALALLITAYFIPGIVVESLYVAVIAAIILGLINLIVRPILFVLTLPVTILTLGLFTFVLNALLFWFAASFIEGFYVSGFLAALLGSILVSIINTVGYQIVD